ncbi:DUF3298 and DUF4163 domain-containing protein [Pseudoxanthomonas helianthi]|uniref:DUF3298 and DUF4163 domain-containing protein n=1 Tax=Pseudoxanthomonas helianthi TaxID=1453541 RepID=A0A940X470_9GAMM|nr:DUF3298 and DUF4163 domain-containing protein [Pseudoxanthomonas helianthi]
MRSAFKFVALSALALAVLAACRQESPTATPAAAPDAAAPTAPAGAPAQLKDVIEHNDRYVVGVSYPPKLNAYPGLAQAVAAYVKAEQDELMEAVEALGNDKPTAPYELSLSFEQVLDTPDIVAVAGDGSRYTGGAHGEPLVARFVWLPKQNKLLTADELIPDAKGWLAVSGYAREQLRTAVSVRADADEMPPEERQQFVANADKMIDAGTEPDSANFRQFQPLADAQGKVTALRFVFPPYQVGPYADGTQSVDVPIDVVRPYLAPEYVGLFSP